MEDTDERERFFGQLTIPEGQRVFGSRFFDVEGRQWLFDRKKGFPGFWRMIFDRSDAEPTGDLKSALDKVARNLIKNWLEKDAKKIISETLLKTNPWFSRCINEAEKGFRKDFVEAMGQHGAALLEKLLTQRIDEIIKISADKFMPKSRVLSSWGPLPSGTRFRWQMQTPKSVYDMFCLEFPPQKRSVNFDWANGYHTLAFPWVVAFVCFKDGLFFTPAGVDGHKHAFWFFYSRKKISGANDELFFSNLPNSRTAFPYLWCLSSSTPVIKLEDPLWCDKIFDWFWGSKFTSGAMGHWETESYAKQITEVRSLKAWKELSAKDPEKMLTLPWRHLGLGIQDFAKKILEYFSEEDSPKESKKRTKELGMVCQAQVRKFREEFEEEIHFLGAHFAVPADLQEQAKNFWDSTLKENADLFFGSLENYANRIAREAFDEFCKANSSGKEEAE